MMLALKKCYYYFSFFLSAKTASYEIKGSRKKIMTFKINIKAEKRKAFPEIISSFMS